MSKVNNIKRGKLVIAILCVFAAHVSMGSFTGTSDENSKNKYSLKNFNKNFYKKASPYSIRAGFAYKGTQIIRQQPSTNGVTFNSILRYEKGNTTYVYPYKHKVSVPKFKTPTPPSIQ